MSIEMHSSCFAPTCRILYNFTRIPDVLRHHFRIIALTLPLIVIICLCGVFCFGPLSLYLTWLGRVNRRTHSTVMSGSWDFVSLIAGLSGFLLFGGGMLLAGLQSSARTVFRGNWAAFHIAWESERLAWLLTTLLYLLLVVGLILLGLRSRRRTLSVYNTTREETESAIEASLAEVGIVATRFGNLWSAGQNVVAIDDFPGLRHTTLKLFITDDRLREEFDRLLRLKIASYFHVQNPIAVWITSGAMFCIFFAMACVGLLWFIFFVS